MEQIAKPIFEKWYKEIVENRSSWVPTQGNRDMETVNHIYRVIIQNHDTLNFVDEFNALIDIQNDDGGWGNRSKDKESQVRCTAFATQMLYRANNDLPERSERFDNAIYRGQSWLISQQREDGTWFDKEWGLYDAVSVNVGTLMFGRMLPGVPQRIRCMLDEPWEKGMDFVLRTQKEHGGWEYKEKYDTPVCVTAHLLQKTLGYEEKGLESSRKAVRYLIQAQHPEGHYDGKNTDHTCDSIRALMLASELMNDFSSHEAIERGFRWLIENRNEDDGWGDFTGDPTDTLMVTDALDTILKYNRYQKIYQKAKNNESLIKR